MKAFFIYIIFGIISLTSFGQRMNEHGLKMVSEIEFFQPDYTHVFIKFKYDEKGKLIRMSVYGTSHLYRDFIKTADGLEVKDYGSYNFSSLKWETTFGSHGNISSIAVFDEFAPGAIMKNEFNFFYEKDGMGTPYRLSRYSNTETSKRKGQSSWHGTSVGTLYTEIYYKDGFLMDGYLSEFERYKKFIDYNHVNDTNINLPYFFYQIGPTNFLSMQYFTITEWLPCRSKYFIDKKAYLGDYINYKYEYDKDGNLISVEERLRDGYLKKKLTVKYLY